MSGKFLHGACGACLWLCIGAVHAADTTMDKDDVDFVKHAAMGGMLEVDLGTLAAQRAKHEDVRKFGQRMASDHGKANQDLARLAHSKGVTLPAGLDDDARDKKTKLESASADKFDDTYMDMMVDDHEKDVGDFEKRVRNSKDAEVRAFADRTLPTLRSHRDEAKAIDQKIDDAKDAAR